MPTKARAKVTLHAGTVSAAGNTRPHQQSSNRKGFSLIELLAVIGVIAILAALLLAVLSSAKARVRRTVCLGNLRQINLGVRIYADDANDTAPGLPKGQPVWFRYRELLQTYLGLSGPPSPNDKVFACPADTFYYGWNKATGMKYFPQGHFEQARYFYTSYEFNGGNQVTNITRTVFGVEALPGISGRKLSSIKHPDRTVLVAEASAFPPYSWHQPKLPVIAPEGFALPVFNNAPNVVSFVDGHASYLNIYWNSATNANGYYSLACIYDPPAGYDYQWSGD